jgi:hypothetical protein
MPSPCGETSFRFSPFYAIMCDGHDRMCEFVNSDDFMFTVNGTEFKSTIAEAVRLSLLVFECLRSDSACHTFNRYTNMIDTATLGDFLMFVRSHELVELPRAKELTFMSIC